MAGITPARPACPTALHMQTATTAALMCLRPAALCSRVLVQPSQRHRCHQQPLSSDCHLPAQRFRRQRTAVALLWTAMQLPHIARRLLAALSWQWANGTDTAHTPAAAAERPVQAQRELADHQQQQQPVAALAAGPEGTASSEPANPGHPEYTASSACDAFADVSLSEAQRTADQARQQAADASATKRRIAKR